MKKIALGLLISILLGGCFSSDGPETVLQKFLYSRFRSETSIETLKSYSTGEVLEHINGLEGDSKDLKNYLNIAEKRKLKLRTYKIISKNCEQTQCFLTYNIKFYEGEGAKRTTVEVRNTAQLDLVEETWKVSKISQGKTFIDSREPLREK